MILKGLSVWREVVFTEQTYEKRGRYLHVSSPLHSAEIEKIYRTMCSVPMAKKWRVQKSKENSEKVTYWFLIKN